MARVVLTARAFADLECIFEFIAASDADRALGTLSRLRDAVLIPEEHPMIGRHVEDGRRELVMGRGAEACLALYRWVPAAEVVLVLAVRNALEAGYQGE